MKRTSSAMKFQVDAPLRDKYRECPSLYAYVCGKTPDSQKFSDAFFWCMKNDCLNLLLEIQRKYPEFKNRIALGDSEHHPSIIEEAIAAITSLGIRCDLMVVIPDPLRAQYLAGCLVHPNCAISKLGLKFPSWNSEQCGSLTAGLGASIVGSSINFLYLKGPDRGGCQLELEFLEEIIASPQLKRIALGIGLRWHGMLLEFGVRIERRVNECLNSLLPITPQMARAYAHAIAANDKNFRVIIALSSDDSHMQWIFENHDLSLKMDDLVGGANRTRSNWIACESLSLARTLDEDEYADSILDSINSHEFLVSSESHELTGRYVAFSGVLTPARRRKVPLYLSFLCGIDLNIFRKDEIFLDLDDELALLSPTHHLFGIAMQQMYPVLSSECRLSVDVNDCSSWVDFLRSGGCLTVVADEDSGVQGIINFLETRDFQPQAVDMLLGNWVSDDEISRLTKALLKSPVSNDICIEADRRCVNMVMGILNGRLPAKLCIGIEIGEDLIPLFTEAFRNALQSSLQCLIIYRNSHLLKALINAMHLVKDRCSLRSLEISEDHYLMTTDFLEEVKEAVLLLPHLHDFQFSSGPVDPEIERHLAGNRRRPGFTPALVKEFSRLWVDALGRPAHQRGGVSGSLQVLWRYLDGESIRQLASASRTLHRAARLDLRIDQVLASTQARAQQDLGWIPRSIPLGRLSDVAFAHLLQELSHCVRRALADADLLAPLPAAPPDLALAQQLRELVEDVHESEISSSPSLVRALSGQEPGRGEFDACVGWCAENDCMGVIAALQKRWPGFSGRVSLNGEDHDLDQLGAFAGHNIRCQLSVGLRSAEDIETLKKHLQHLPASCTLTVAFEMEDEEEDEDEEEEEVVVVVPAALATALAESRVRGLCLVAEASRVTLEEGFEALLFGACRFQHFGLVGELARTLSVKTLYDWIHRGKLRSLQVRSTQDQVEAFIHAIRLAGSHHEIVDLELVCTGNEADPPPEASLAPLDLFDPALRIEKLSIDPAALGRITPAQWRQLTLSNHCLLDLQSLGPEGSAGTLPEQAAQLITRNRLRRREQLRWAAPVFMAQWARSLGRPALANRAWIMALVDDDVPAGSLFALNRSTAGLRDPGFQRSRTGIPEANLVASVLRTVPHSPPQLGVRLIADQLRDFELRPEEYERLLGALLRRLEDFLKAERARQPDSSAPPLGRDRGPGLALEAPTGGASATMQGGRPAQA